MTRTPEPALAATGVTGVVLSTASVLSLVGLHTAGDFLSTSSTAIAAVIVGLATLAGPLLAGLHIRARVAPVVATVQRLEPAIAELVSGISDEMDPEPDNVLPSPTRREI